jgi:hypothetical protein
MRTLTNKQWTISVFAVCLVAFLSLLLVWFVIGPLPAAW